jgi:hypothetical protein
MNRRRFALSLAASAALRAVPRPGVKIDRISLAPIEGRFHKFVAMNSYDTAPKGHTYEDTLLRIAASN